MSKAQYKREIDEEYQRRKRGEITKREFERRERLRYDEFLAREHATKGTQDIFIKLVLETKNLYADWKDKYYCGKVSRGEYLRGISSNQGLRFYDSEIFRVGLSKRWPDAEFDSWLWKAYKVEREILPERLIDPRNDKCPPGMKRAARETMRIMFQGLDDYHKKYVISLGDVQIRSESWAQNDEELEAFKLPPLDVTVTRRDALMFEQFRSERVDSRPRRL